MGTEAGKEQEQFKRNGGGADGLYLVYRFGSPGSGAAATTLHLF
jgi:hypothetical protein